MNDVLLYFYNIKLDNDNATNNCNKFRFSYNNKKYIMTKQNNVLNDVLEELRNNSIFFKPLMNKYNTYITNYKNKTYVLVEETAKKDREIVLDDIIYLSKYSIHLKYLSSTMLGKEFILTELFNSIKHRTCKL